MWTKNEKKNKLVIILENILCFQFPERCFSKHFFIYIFRGDLSCLFLFFDFITNICIAQKKLNNSEDGLKSQISLINKRKSPSIFDVIFILWSFQPGLNWRPQPYHGCALPTELQKHVLSFVFCRHGGRRYIRFIVLLFYSGRRGRRPLHVYNVFVLDDHRSPLQQNL